MTKIKIRHIREYNIDNIKRTNKDENTFTRSTRYKFKIILRIKWNVIGFLSHKSFPPFHIMSASPYYSVRVRFWHM